MPFNTILGATRIGPSGSDTFDPPSITTLTDGSFVVSYDVIDYANDDQIVTDVFNAQGQLVQESFAKPLPHFAEDTPSVAGLDGGGYALAWTEAVFDPSGSFLQEQVFTALYDSAGNQISASVRVDSGTALDGAGAPEVVALTGGGYVVTWLLRDDAQAGSDDLMATIYDSTGQQVGPPINVSNSPGVNDAANSLTTSVAALPDGGFALTWTEGPFDAREVYTAIYDGTGQQILAPFNVTQSAGVDESQPQIAVLTNGNYVVIWDEIGPQPSVHTAVFDAQGNELAAPAAIGSGQNSHVLALSNGGYAVSWSDGDLFTAVYDSQGSLVAGPVDVSGTPAGGSSASALTALANGAFALTYGANAANGSIDIFTAIYSATGEELVAPVNVTNTPGFDEQFQTVEAQATANGSYAITWQGAGTLLNAEYLAIYQFTDDQNVDNVSVVGSNDVTIDLSAIINVGGDVIVSDNGNLVNIDLHNLASVGGNFVVSDNGALLTLTLPSLTTVGGNVDVSGNTAATVIDANSLTTVSGSVDISDNNAATTVGLGSLTTVVGSVDLSGNTAATDINIGDLTSVGGSLDLSDNTAATTVGLGSLTTVGGSVDLSGDTAATDINIGDLTSVGGSLDLSGAVAVITIDLSSLIQAGALVIAEDGVVVLDLSALVSTGGDVSISDNHALLTVDLPELDSVDGNLDISGNTSATAINAGNLTTVDGNVDISGNDAATVVDASSLVTVSGNVTIDLAPDATVDASAFGPGGGTVRVIGDDGRETTVILGSLAQMGGLLTITTADGVALTSTAGLGTITLTGTAGDNTLIGSAAAHNVFDSGAGDDVATGGGNDDLFIGGAGDDRLDGGDGIDTAAFSGNFTDFSVTRHADGSLTVTDIRVGATDGTDTLSNIELLQFADGMLTLAEALPEPVITSDGAGATALLAITENTTEVTQVAATNPNSVAALQFTIAGGTDAEKFHIDAATGELSFVVAPDFEQPTDADGDNVYELIVQASDGFQSDTQVLDVNVTNANETPTLTIQTADQSATAGAAFSLVLPAGTFQDPDSGDHLTLTAALGNGSALPEWLAFDPATGAFSGTPGTGDAGEVDIAVTATDAGGLTAADGFHLSISAATNHAPVITSDLGGATASVIITDHTRDVTRVQAVDPDPDTRLTYAIVGGHDRALFDIDAETGELSFKKMPKDGHNYQVTVAASDGNLQDTQAINVQVAKGLFELGNAGIADTFEFAPHFGLALVEHFDATSPAHDVLDFDHRLFRNADPDASPDAAFNLIAHHSFQFGHNVVIVTDTFDTIVLRNIGLQDLTASDFHIV